MDIAEIIKVPQMRLANITFNPTVYANGNPCKVFYRFPWKAEPKVTSIKKIRVI
jgi:hypothetical protein